MSNDIKEAMTILRNFLMDLNKGDIPAKLYAEFNGEGAIEYYVGNYIWGYQELNERFTNLNELIGVIQEAHNELRTGKWNDNDRLRALSPRHF